MSYLQGIVCGFVTAWCLWQFYRFFADITGRRDESVTFGTSRPNDLTTHICCRCGRPIVGRFVVRSRNGVIEYCHPTYCEREEIRR